MMNHSNGTTTAPAAANQPREMPAANSTDAVEQLRAAGYTLLAVEQVRGATLLSNWNPAEQTGEERFAIVFGNEVEGVGQEVVDLCDGALEIPQVGTKHSLNVAVSGGIVLWEFFRRFGRR